MIRPILFILTALMIAPVGFAQDAPASPETDQATARSWDEYQVIVERSMFSRDRRPPRPPVVDAGPTEPREVAPPPPPPPLQSFYVLIGVSVSDGRTTAFVEDRRSGTIHAVEEGDELAERVVTIIGLDKITISPTTDDGGDMVEIALGRTLTGDAPAGAPVASRSGSSSPTTGGSSPASSASSPSTGSSSGDSASSDSGGTMSVLERLRQRRQQEQQ